MYIPPAKVINGYQERPFTPREVEILLMLFSGRSQSDIAEMLFLSRNTVKNHIANMCEVSDCHSTIELIRYYVDALLLEKTGIDFTNLVNFENCLLTTI